MESWLAIRLDAARVSTVGKHRRRWIWIQGIRDVAKSVVGAMQTHKLQERERERDERPEMIEMRDEMRWEMRRGNGKAVRAEQTYAEACARFLDQSHRSTTPWPTVTAHIAHSDHASGNAPLFKEGIAPEKSEVISTDVAKR